MRKHDVTVLLLGMGVAAVGLVPVTADAARHEDGVLVGGMIAMESYSRDMDMHQSEAVVSLPWPWRQDHADGSAFFLRTDFSVGAIADSETRTGLVTGGWRLGWITTESMMLDVGWRVALLGNSNLGRRDLDGPVQFISHARIGLLFAKNWEAGIRLQHMSNGGLYDSNPGVNLLMFDLGRHF